MPTAGDGRTAEKVARRAARGERFSAAMGTAARHLPFGLNRVVPPSLLGFALINGCTFGIDLVLLTVFHGVLHWPVWLSITLSYGTATSISFLLNRGLNFRSHGAVGVQVPLYVAVVVVNYLALILGVGAGLSALGAEFQLARIIAGACEGIYMYLAMRFLVFRRSPGARDPAPATGTGPASEDSGAALSDPGRTGPVIRSGPRQ